MTKSKSPTNETNDKDQPVDERFVKILVDYGTELLLLADNLGDSEDVSEDIKLNETYAKLCQAECNRALAAQRQALRDEVEKAIGEDEPHVKIGTNPASLPNVRRKTRNTLRANLRTAISTIFEDKGGKDE